MFLMSDLEVLESGRPCTEREILDAECMLGFSLPTELRNAYLNANGFTGPSEARFLSPLARREAFSFVTMLRLTQVLRRLPTAASLWNAAVAFGDYGIGSTWGMTSEGRVFEWWPEDGDEPFFLDVSLQQLWSERSKLFDSLSAS